MSEELQEAADAIEALFDRFWAKVEPQKDGCWIWTASLKPQGYGQIYRDGRPAYAHRISYELYVGPIPDGLEIDHLCRVRRCVNPAHLEAVTRTENARRVPQAPSCPQGHLFTPETTRLPLPGSKQGRKCRICERERQRV